MKEILLMTDPGEMPPVQPQLTPEEVALAQRKLEAGANLRAALADLDMDRVIAEGGQAVRHAEQTGTDAPLNDFADAVKKRGL